MFEKYVNCFLLLHLKYKTSKIQKRKRLSRIRKYECDQNKYRKRCSSVRDISVLFSSLATVPKNFSFHELILQLLLSKIAYNQLQQVTQETSNMQLSAEQNIWCLS